MPKETAATKLERLVDEEVDESFPASDPPSFSGTHAGTPCPAPDEEDEQPLNAETPSAPSAAEE